MKITIERKQMIIDLIRQKSISEVASIVGCSTTTVSKIIKENGIVRTSEEKASIRSNTRSRLVRAERRRAIFGLDQKSNLKVFSNKERAIIKYCLKRKGYRFPFRGVNTAYYDSETIRDKRYEDKGKKVGIRFIPA